MLLAHGWLAPLSKPATISEEDELSEEVSSLNLVAGSHSSGQGISGENIYDREVAEWCKHALERKKSGKMGSAAKPALHAAPLDSVSPAASPAAVA